MESNDKKIVLRKPVITVQLFLDWIISKKMNFCNRIIGSPSPLKIHPRVAPPTGKLRGAPVSITTVEFKATVQTQLFPNNCYTTESISTQSIIKPPKKFKISHSEARIVRYSIHLLPL
jgi:hypothetical protein